MSHASTWRGNEAWTFLQGRPRNFWIERVDQRVMSIDVMARWKKSGWKRQKGLFPKFCSRRRRSWGIVQIVHVYYDVLRMFVFILRLDLACLILLADGVINILANTQLWRLTIWNTTTHYNTRTNFQPLVKDRFGSFIASHNSRKQCLYWINNIYHICITSQHSSPMIGNVDAAANPSPSRS